MKKYTYFNFRAVPTLVVMAAFFTLPVLALPAVVYGQTYANVSSSFVLGASDPSLPTPACLNLTSNLFMGARNAYTAGQVSQLQAYLKTRGYYSYSVTGLYGGITYSAVVRYQRAHNIAGTGYVGPLTRAAIQAESCGTVVPPIPGAPAVSYLNPSSGAVGTMVTITGSGFTADNTVKFSYGDILHVSSTNGTTLTFVVPSSLNPSCYYSVPSCLMPTQMVVPGNYSVSVQNSNGTSNSLTFTVTSGTPIGSPQISSIVPSSGPVGTTFTIIGSGFTSDNNIKFDIGGVSHVVAGNNGTTLTYTVPSYVGYICSYSMPNCAVPMLAKQITPGNYNVSVENAYGMSNTVTFTVTGQSGLSPVISYLSPSSGATGSSVTVYGSGFSSTGNTVKFGSLVVSNIPSYNGTTLTFNVPIYVTYCPPGVYCIAGTVYVQPGNYDVSVQNANGNVSNSAVFTVTSNTSGGQTPVISAVSGPTDLAVYQSGTWSITARDPSYGSQLSYNVTWGDEGYYPYAMSSAGYYSSPQTSTFSHSYSQPGTYTITFTVTNNLGVSSKATMTVTVR